MASASSEPLGHELGAEHERIAQLEAELERSERRREAAEEWAEFLEAELQTRDERLESVIQQYEAQLEAAKRDTDDDGAGGLWERVTGWF